MVMPLKCRVILLLAVLSFVLTGCSIYSSQLNTIKKIYTDDTKALAKYSWMLSFGSHQAEVFAVDQGDVTVFGNHLGDGIVLKDWELRELRGLGRFRYIWQIFHKDNYRMFYELGAFQGSYQCQKWLASESLDGMLYKQSCRSSAGKQFDNTIRVSQDGQATEMKFSILGESEPIVLTRRYQ